MKNNGRPLRLFSLGDQERTVFEHFDLKTAVTNGGIYAIGVGLFVIGTLGLSGAIALHAILSAITFTLGILVVLAVHEYLGGPI